ncbi:MAG TPA: ATP-dependent helicase HrpB [Gammaproteobacteria bacterium]|nr:ATP-dependent helicase HrpB [Gammaproteobacteria bacterium]
MASAFTEPLPIDPVLPDLIDTLASHTRAVLQAPPGAGKTTRVPLALLADAHTTGWLGDRRIVMLEPRRLAARAAARRMAASLGESVGQTVGYRVRLDSRVGPDTRIEVVTEGVLTRQLQSDAALEDVGLVIFDEFHERSLQADLGLALALESQGALRPDLRVLVMSATLDGERVAHLLAAAEGDAPVLTSEGRAFPVDIRYQPRARRGEPASGAGRCEPAQVARAVRAALEDEPGSALVFLPGVGEIRRVESLLREAPLPADVELAPLYGDLSQGDQDRAVSPAPPGRRKVVLATAIAETSLTIEGIRIVIDAGFMRRPRFEPNSGMTRLETLRVSRASAEQRCGRAGRLEPGVCYRLWSEQTQAALTPYTAPEILEADLAPLALELAHWGAGDPNQLAWLDPPPAAHYAQARDLLTRLGALDTAGRITEHGRAMAGLGMHPRLAHLVLKGRELDGGMLGALACDLAALLSERDPRRRGGPGSERDSDVHTRLVALRHGGNGASQMDQGALQRIRQVARQWREQLNIAPAPRDNSDLAHAGLLLALAYPDRIGQRRSASTGTSEPRYRLANGRGAMFAAAEPLAASEYVVAAHLDAGAREARIFLAAALARDELLEHFAEAIEECSFVSWDEREEAVVARRQRRLGELVLDDTAQDAPEPEAVAAAMVDGIRGMGLECLPWNKSLRAWRERVAFLHRVEDSGRFGQWPDVSDAALLDTLETWLGPYLAGCTRRAHLAKVDLRAALTGLLDWQQQRALDELAPTHITVPTGSRIAVDYSGEEPVLAVKLQEMFGERDTPRINGGRVPVLLHLLSPAGRPVQVTRDLAGFWQGSYHDVKKDLKGRYPKHPWPDDPLSATPTRRAKPRG